MAEVIPFPVPTSCSGRTMPGLTTPELREVARLNFYTAERRQGIDPFTAYDRAEAFVKDLERIAEIMSQPFEDGEANYRLPQGHIELAPSSSFHRGGKGHGSLADGRFANALPVREPSTEQS